ncbi:MAG TPA: cupredoxin domain-containing protein [Planctomycetota bacterium]|jgi:plastocyanin
MSKTSALVLTFALLLVAKGGMAATVNVSIVSFAFQPATPTISVGDTIIWTNNGDRQHTSTSDTGVWDSGALNPGDSFSFMYNAAGSFPFHCNFHPTIMTGTVTVNGPSGPTAPSITSPLTTSGSVGTTFNYMIMASGTTPITFTASPLPDGLSLSGDTISGTPTTAGTTQVTLGASNSVGSDSKTLAITIGAAGGGSGISGQWTGSFRVKFFAQTAGSKAATSNGAATATFTQSESTLTATITAGSKTYSMNGQIGGGNFWLTGATADGSENLVLSGHVTSKNNAMKGVGVSTNSTGAGEIGFTLKKSP